ncbi:hypothetical protein AMECASPLE_007871 [Ameca splendens]|uniref:Uncharacterized protein n=1 Tax=Ameca splendens TaxID=208324 RepID=A0ABV0YXP7_9TELE
MQTTVRLNGQKYVERLLAEMKLDSLTAAHSEGLGGKRRGDRRTRPHTGERKRSLNLALSWNILDMETLATL